MSCNDSAEVRPALDALADAGIALAQSEADAFHGARFGFDTQYGTEEWWATRIADGADTDDSQAKWDALLTSERAALKAEARAAARTTKAGPPRIPAPAAATLIAAADSLSSPRTLRALRERLAGGPARCARCGAILPKDPASGALLPCNNTVAPAHWGRSAGPARELALPPAEIAARLSQARDRLADPDWVAGAVPAALVPPPAFGAAHEPRWSQAADRAVNAVLEAAGEGTGPLRDAVKTPAVYMLTDSELAEGWASLAGTLRLLDTTAARIDPPPPGSPIPVVDVRRESLRALDDSTLPGVIAYLDAEERAARMQWIQADHATRHAPDAVAWRRNAARQDWIKDHYYWPARRAAEEARAAQRLRQCRVGQVAALPETPLGARVRLVGRGGCGCEWVRCHEPAWASPGRGGHYARLVRVGSRCGTGTVAEAHDKQVGDFAWSQDRVQILALESAEPPPGRAVELPPAARDAGLVALRRRGLAATADPDQPNRVWIDVEDDYYHYYRDMLTEGSAEVLWTPTGTVYENLDGTFVLVPSGRDSPDQPITELPCPTCQAVVPVGDWKAHADDHRWTPLRELDEQQAIDLAAEMHALDREIFGPRPGRDAGPAWDGVGDPHEL